MYRNQLFKLLLPCACLLALAACEDDSNWPKDELLTGKGTVDLSTFTLTVNTDNVAATGLAAPSVDDFSVIFAPVGHKADTLTMSYSTLEPSIVIPSGGYTITAQNIPAASLAWDAPRYASSREMNVTKNETTVLAPMDCTLANMMVKLAFEDVDGWSFMLWIEDGTVAQFTSSETRSPFFTVPEGATTMMLNATLPSGDTMLKVLTGIANGTVYTLNISPETFI
ncbi:MAG: DUF4493 domain-containing protein [Bacteroidales bacterium]|nr:DUF4493 domain-containing protein [Bacteroidales bacterium]